MYAKMQLQRKDQAVTLMYSVHHLLHVSRLPHVVDSNYLATDYNIHKLRIGLSSESHVQLEVHPMHGRMTCLKTGPQC